MTRISVLGRVDRCAIHSWVVGWLVYISRSHALSQWPPLHFCFLLVLVNPLLRSKSHSLAATCHRCSLFPSENLCLTESERKQVVRGLEVEGQPGPKQEISSEKSYSNLIGSVVRTEFPTRTAMTPPQLAHELQSAIWSNVGNLLLLLFCFWSLHNMLLTH